MRLRSTPTGITRRRALQSLAVGLPTLALGAARPTRLKLSTAVLKDPDGHRSTLRLRGDWIFIAISDGKHSGIGEISHSTDDGACLHRIRQLFSTHLAERSPSLAALSELHAGPFGAAPDLIAATAISGIDQAIHDLIAKREGIPVWQLYSQSAAVDRLPFYFSINRALTTRAPAEFVRLTTVCRNLGVPAVKIMPFEAVTAGTEQIEQSREGNYIFGAWAPFTV